MSSAKGVTKMDFGSLRFREYAEGKEEIDRPLLPERGRKGDHREGHCVGSL